MGSTIIYAKCDAKIKLREARMIACTHLTKKNHLTSYLIPQLEITLPFDM